MRKLRGWRGCDRSRLRRESINIPFWMRFNCRGDRRSPILNDEDDYARITVSPVDLFSRLRLCVSRSILCKYVTIVTRDRQCLFGDIVDRQTRLNLWGKKAQDE